MAQMNRCTLGRNSLFAAVLIAIGGWSPLTVLADEDGLGSAVPFDFSLQPEEGASEVQEIKLEKHSEPEELSQPSYSSDPEILWPGFLWGLRGFEKMTVPVGQPLYFEDPFIRTDFRFIYLYHDIPQGSQLRGGHIQVFALQARIALTERLAFIATKDNYSNVRAKILPDADGYNDIAWGLKYAIAYDVDEQWIFSGGMRWELENGNRDVLQGDSQELSPFLSYAHRWDKLTFLTAVSWRIPMDHHDAVHSLLWDVHLSYELLENFYPLVEIHGLHYLSNADRIPLSVDGLDYANIGATDVAGHSVYWAGIGFRWRIIPRLSAGFVYEFPLMNPDRDIFENRYTVNIVYSL